MTDGHTLQFSFSYIYSTKLHSERLGFLGYKTTGFFDSWTFLPIMILANLQTLSLYTAHL